MRTLLPSIAVISLVTACTATAPRERATDRTTAPEWDDRSWAVLQAGDLRRTTDLCAMLRDSSSTVRRSAALALAGVQDTASRPCLAGALNDPEARVREAAGFALGLVADSMQAALLARQVVAEQDTQAHRVLEEALLMARLRLRLTTTESLLEVVAGVNTPGRLRAAQALARLPQEQREGLHERLSAALDREREPAARMFLIAALAQPTAAPTVALLRALATTDPLPMVRIAAVRAVGATGQDLLMDRAVNDADPGVRLVAAEQLQRATGPLDGTALWNAARSCSDPAVRLMLLGLVQAHAPEEVAASCRVELEAARRKDQGAYLNAAAIRAAGMVLHPDTLLELVRGPGPAVERQAAFSAAMAQVRDRMARSRFASMEARFAELSALVAEVINTGDAGLISSVAEMLQEEDSEAIALLLPPGAERKAIAHLHPVCDLEARILLEAAVAKRDGAPAPTATAPPYNHPIQRGALAGIKEDARYRIVTTKGDIVLALEPGTAPGSCVAFDSLVTAGYYDGKAFHRIVPNFVAQGGCPRGDGYGGMPWTLRTEVGLQGFNEGAVGLASAGRDTESCQFFIMLAPAPHLDGRYTRFAHVVSGLDIAKKLQVGDVMKRVERVQ